MNIKDFQASLPYLVQAELTPFIWGHAGIGKTSIVKQYAQEMGYKFFPFYLGTQSDIGDILGLAEFVDNGDGTKSTAFAIPKWLKETITYCEQNPDSGAIIFLDEFNRARRDILNGMFSLALDKTFHTLKLPKNCHLIAAGNPPTDEYFTTDVDETALMARFVHVKLEPTFDEWLQFAKTAEIDSNLIGFLKNQPELLEQKHSDFQLPVKVDRRSFERLNRLFKLNTPTHLLEQMMMGIIGLERTVAFQQYLKKADKPLEGAAILDTNNRPLIEKWSNGEDTTASLLNITCENLKEFLLKFPGMLNSDEKAQLMWFLTMVPKDISFPLIKTLTETKNVLFKDFFTDPIYEEKLVDLVTTAKGRKEDK